MDARAAEVSPSTVQVLSGLDIGPDFYWFASRCQGCEALAFWAGKKLTYPSVDSYWLDEPHESLPEDAKALLAEAIAVFPISRRASAALCRASLESLLKTVQQDLAMKRPTLEDRINALENSVSPQFWKLLTTIRHVGNKSLHGADDSDSAVAMFLDENDDYVPRLLIGVVNQLAEQLIEIPGQTNALFAAIPAAAREAAERKAGRLTENSGTT
ncbi:hypothetical protein B5P43_15590 [Bacillus sp. SRB_336]|nr:hypothetical protein B5P43_15590 [Bacillus sp. SRB_336]